LDCTATVGHQQAAPRHQIRPIQLKIIVSQSQRQVLRQHLIDPVVCIRCNTCEETCPVDAITHDSRNYVVDPAICNGCNACISPCPTGAIDSWRQVVRTSAHSLAEQFAWDTLPAQQDVADEAGSAIPQEIA